MCQRFPERKPWQSFALLSGWVPWREEDYVRRGRCDCIRVYRMLQNDLRQCPIHLGNEGEGGKDYQSLPCMAQGIHGLFAGLIACID